MVVRKFLLPFFLHLTYGILPALFADSFSCISNTLASLISLLVGERFSSSLLLNYV